MPMSTEQRPTEAEIRRALAEVMSLADIDAEMGWSPGTARKGRGKPHGLPEPDARVGGSPVWFRSTFEAWRAARPGRGAGGGRPRKVVEQLNEPPSAEPAGAYPPAELNEGVSR